MDAVRRRRKTNWYILTGGPCSGKTKTIEYLAFLGHKTIPEAARVFIDNEASKGIAVEQLRKDEIEFQRKVLDIKKQVEERIDESELYFFDRAVPDTIAYDKINGINTEELEKYSMKTQYKKVFFLEQLKYEKDDARVEDDQLGKLISEKLYEIYTNLGYTLIIIPANSIEERARLILKHVE
ncbi:MAG: hypothetical protein DRN66_02705 [Candidatus Nanohalarchaeota archaeon]|nr:MAG: hypothetical protein DRN66_02705 [Candidatus Nanohaloarchaeota archaeon]